VPGAPSFRAFRPLQARLGLGAPTRHSPRWFSPGPIFSATTDGWPEEAVDSALPGGRLNGHLRVEIDAQRGALDSLQQHSIEVDSAGYGYQYGNYYGGI